MNYGKGLARSSARGQGYKTVLSTPCSNSMLKPRFHTVLNAQRRSPNFLSTVSYSDLSMERSNPEYAQDHGMLNAVLKQTKMAAHAEIGRFIVKVRRF